MHRRNLPHLNIDLSQISARSQLNVNSEKHQKVLHCRVVSAKPVLYKTKTDFLKYGPWLTTAAYYLLKPFQQLFAAQSAANNICSSTLAATICTNQRRQTFAATVCSTVHNQHLQRSPCANKLHKLSAATFAATLCVRDLHRPASETQHLQQTSAATNCRKLFQ